MAERLAGSSEDALDEGFDGDDDVFAQVIGDAGGVALALFQDAVQQALARLGVGDEGGIAEEAPEGGPFVVAVGIEESGEVDLQVLAGHGAALAVQAQAVAGSDDGPAGVVVVQGEFDGAGDGFFGYWRLGIGYWILGVVVAIQIGAEAVEVYED